MERTFLGSDSRSNFWAPRNSVVPFLMSSGPEDLCLGLWGTLNMFYNLHTLDRPLLERRSMGLDTRLDLGASRNSLVRIFRLGEQGSLSLMLWVTFTPLSELAHGPQVHLHDGGDLPEGHLRAGHLVLTLLADSQLPWLLTELLLQGLSVKRRLTRSWESLKRREVQRP